MGGKKDIAIVTAVAMVSALFGAGLVVVAVDEELVGGTRGGEAQMLTGINEYDVINYGTGGHSMMVCWPNDGAKHPAIILLHGGGWTSGTRMSIIEQTRALAREGIVACSIDYTLATPATEPALPRAMQDITDAVAKVRTFPCAAGQPISIGGISAGGHLAIIYAATQAHTLHGVVVVDAPTDLEQWEAMFDIAGNPALNYLLGSGYTQATLHAASPMHMSIAGLTVPVFLLRGGSDVCGESTEMLPLYLRLAPAGKAVRLFRFEGGDHELTNAIPEFAGAVYSYLQ